MAAIQSRTLSELVAALPGRATELTTLLAIALQRSLTLEAEVLNRDMADARVSINQGFFDPALRFGTTLATGGFPGSLKSRSIDAGVGTMLPWGTQLDVSWTGGKNRAFVDEPSVRYGTDLSLSVRQPLLQGLGVTTVDLLSSRLRREAAGYALAQAQEQVAVGIEILYWNLAEAEAAEAVFQRSFDISEAFLFRNQQLAARQLMADVDVITAQSGVELRRSSLIGARRRRIDAAERLIFAAYGAGAAQRLASDPLPLKTVTAPPDGAVDVARAEDEEQAIEQRRNVAASRAVVEASEQQLRRAQSGLRPQLSLDGTWAGANRAETSGGAFGGLRANPAWSLGLSMSVPIGNRSDRGSFETARLSLALSRVDLTLTENSVRQEVRRSARAVSSGLERLGAADEASRLAAAQLSAEQQRLDLGLGDSFRLLQTEENAVRAELEAVQARYALARATADLRLARGEILQR